MSHPPAHRAHLHLLNELLLIQGTGQVPLVPQDEDLQGRTGDTLSTWPPDLAGACFCHSAELACDIRQPWLLH